MVAHERDQFVVGDLHHQLVGRHGVDDVHANSLFLHAISEFLGDGIAHIGVNERLAAYLLGCLRNVDFSDSALTFQDFERAF